MARNAFKWFPRLGLQDISCVTALKDGGDQLCHPQNEEEQPQSQPLGNKVFRRQCKTTLLRFLCFLLESFRQTADERHCFGLWFVAVQLFPWCCFITIWWFYYWIYTTLWHFCVRKAAYTFLRCVQKSWHLVCSPSRLPASWNHSAAFAWGAKVPVDGVGRVF